MDSISLLILDTHQVKLLADQYVYPCVAKTCYVGIKYPIQVSPKMCVFVALVSVDICRISHRILVLRGSQVLAVAVSRGIFIHFQGKDSDSVLSRCHKTHVKHCDSKDFDT